MEFAEREEIAGRITEFVGAFILMGVGADDDVECTTRFSGVVELAALRGLLSDVEPLQLLNPSAIDPIDEHLESMVRDLDSWYFIGVGDVPVAWWNISPDHQEIHARGLLELARHHVSSQFDDAFSFESQIADESEDNTQ